MKEAPIQFLESRPLMVPALALADEIGSSLYDGPFVALTIQLGGQLVIADAELFRRLQSSRRADRARFFQ
jgi:predicted nucleic acid-binding protein